MAEIHWIKLKTKMFDDEKIQLIEAMPEADAILVIWMKLLIQAGKTNSNGFILLAENIPYTTEMLSTIFRRPLQIVKFALKVLKDFGMIDVTDGNVICVTNWEKHQNVGGLEKIREDTRKRVAKYRLNQRIVTLPVTQGNATESESESESESEGEGENVTPPAPVFFVENKSADNLLKAIASLDNIKKLEKQLTYDEAVSLVTNYKSEEITSVIRAMENSKGIEDKNISVYLTAKKWIERDRKGK